MFLETPELPDDVRAELDDPRFAGRQHYSRATYAQGCHGPLCQLRETHRGRRRNELRAQAEEREYKPQPDNRKLDRDKELIPIIRWHLAVRSSERAGLAVTA